MVRRSIDIGLISSIVNHPRVFGWLVDDYSPKVYTPIINPITIYLVDDTDSGVIRIDPLNGVTCQVHMGTLPRMWGNGKKMVLDALEWGFANTKYRKVQAFIPDHNEHVIGLVERCGFKREGVMAKSFLLHGRLHDQIIYGLTKEDYFKCLS